MQQHRIHSAQFQFSVSRHDTALTLRRQLEAAWTEQLEPRLDRLFSELAPEGLTFTMDRLELDLGRISLRQLEQQLIEAIETELRRDIEHRIADQQSKALSGNTSPDFSILTDARRKTQALIHFLQYGFFPWWASSDQAIELLLTLLREDPEGLIHSLGQLKGHRAWSRWVKQFPEKVVQQVYRQKDPSRFSLWQQLHRDFASISLPVISSPAYQLAIVAFLIMGKHTAPTFCAAVLKLQLKEHSAAQTQARKYSHLKRQIQQLPPSSPLRALATGPEAAAFWSKVLDHTPIPAGGEREEVEQPAAPPEDKRTPAEEATSTIQKALARGLPVANAGLVLLAPFLPAFFKQLGLVRGRAFVKDNYRERAVLLCQQLLCGAGYIEENQAVLAKILCGFALEEPIDGQLEATRKEKKEARTLLNAVITHWGVLGKTSLAGLQRAFLQREGMLQKNEQEYVLQLQRLGHDVLLDKLPWSIALIRLPWMARPLSVEW